MVLKNKLSSFTAARLNQSTFAITEDDSFGERPVIYAKVHRKAPIIVLSDTGCNSPSKRTKFIALRQFLEQCPISENDDSLPLNPDGSRSYVILCTHCHFDHILGIEQFLEHSRTASPADVGNQDNDMTQSRNKAQPGIVASLTGRDFIEKDLPTHSLCRYIKVKTPQYQVSHWAANKDRLVWHKDGSITAKQTTTSPTHGDHDAEGVDLEISIFNTPGHTPDELAWYDHDERHLYVGDSFYELETDGPSANIYGGPIIFPKEGNWIDYMSSIRYLGEIVRALNYDAYRPLRRIKVGCGHTTVAADAEELLSYVIELFERIIKGDILPSKTSRNAMTGEVECLWQEDGGRCSVKGPLRLCIEARKERYRDEKFP